MPASNFARINLDLLYPRFRDRLLEVIARLNARGYRYVATHGYRSYGEQMELWKQGRLKPGPIVTNAKGGQSQHNFGLAVDFVFDMDPKTAKVEPGWAAGLYQPLVDELELAGLHSGAVYKDYPHAGIRDFITAVQLAPFNGRIGGLKGLETEPLRYLRVVWSYLDSVAAPLPAY